MATITEDYVSFEIAKLLKEKGFDGACNRVYQGPNLKYTTIPISPLLSLGEFGGFHPKQLYVTNNELGDIAYTAPTLQMAMKWLREVHNIGIFPFTYTHIADRKTIYSYGTAIINLKTYELMTDSYLSNDTYEDAVEAAIKYCLEHLI